MRFFAQFGALDEETYTAGDIDKKHKELMGQAISIVTRRAGCVFYHIEGCLHAGASRREIAEAIKIGGLGGSVTCPRARLALRIVQDTRL